jgi:Fe-S oxidoreductase
MKIRTLFATLAAFACLGVVMAGDLKSGPQVGQGITPFHPHNVFNAELPEKNGKDNCIVCQYGTKPAVLVFARNTGNDVVEMMKKLDAEVGKVGQEKMGAAVIFLSAEDNIKETAKQLIEKAGVKNVCVAVDGPEGPKGYQIAKDADVTVILYKKHKVVANHAFEKFCSACAEKVVADLPKVAAN